MPYKIVKIKNRWAVVNNQTKKIKGRFDNLDKAKKHLRLLQAIEHGFVPKKIDK